MRCDSFRDRAKTAVVFVPLCREGGKLVDAEER